MVAVIPWQLIGVAARPEDDRAVAFEDINPQAPVHVLIVPKRHAQSIAELNAAKIWGRPIVTEVVPFTAFHKAEGYHQEYFRSNPNQGYCMAVVAPKVAKFRKQFSDRLKK